MEVVQQFIAAVNKAFDEEANPVLKELGSQKNRQGYFPSCSKRSPDQKAINA